MPPHPAHRRPVPGLPWVSSVVLLALLGACGGGGGGGAPTPVAAPVLTSQPQPLTVLAGSSASFSVSATGDSLGYQWRKDGVPIPGATASTYALASVAASHAGDYSAVVSNSGGSATSGTARLTVIPRLTLAPGRGYLPVDRSVRLTASGGTGAALTWTVLEPGGGSLAVEPDGRAATYTAPSSPGTFTIRASASAPADAVTAQVFVLSATAAANLGVDISPQRAQTSTPAAQAAILRARLGLSAEEAIALAKVQTKVRFRGSTHGSKETLAGPGGSRAGTRPAAAGPDLIWWVVEGAAGGSVTSTGVYTPPDTFGVFHVAAARADDSKLQAVAEVHVNQPIAGAVARVLPSPAVVGAGEQVYLTAVVNGATDASVAWALEEGAAGGSLAAAGGADPNEVVYTAPAAPGIYHARATSLEDATISTLGFLQVVARPGLDVSPPTIQLAPGESQAFLATAAGPSPGVLTWSVLEGPAGGAVVPSGTSAVYTAPTAPGVYHLSAESAADPTLKASSVITVSGAAPVAVSVSPASLRLDPGGSTAFTATVTGSGNQAVSWSASPGSVDATGLFTAPLTPGTCMVTATSQADGTKSGSATITVAALPAFTSIPPLVAYINAPYAYPLSTQHPNGLPLALSLVSGPAGAVLNGAQLAWTPAAGQTGEAHFEVRATDGLGASATQRWTVEVRGVGIHLVAGALGGEGYREGTAFQARFSSSTKLAWDPLGGGLVLADASNRLVRRMTGGGATSLFAGDRGGGDLDGTGTNARFMFPDGIAVDGAGNTYVMDRGAAKVRKISPGGAATTLAAQSGRNLAVGPGGDVFVTRIDGTAIYRVTAAGSVSTWVGTPGSASYLEGTGTAARFKGIVGIACDAAGNLYVADGGNRVVRKVDPARATSLVAGQPGVAGSADGSGAGATFTSPGALASDGAGNLWVHDAGAIRKVSAAGAVSTWLGAVGTTGHLDLSGTAARFDLVNALALGAGGILYVADGPTVRSADPGGQVSTLAGSIPNFGAVDAVGGNARFNADHSVTQGMRLGPDGALYVVDSRALRRVTMDGTVSTVPGTAGAFAYGAYLALDRAGNAYISDDDSTLKRVAPSGGVTILAGTPTAGTNRTQVDGTGAAARFGALQGIAIAPGGSLIHVVDNKYYGPSTLPRIRTVTPEGVVSTLAGLTNAFDYAFALALDGSGNLYLGAYHDLPGTELLRGAPTGPLTTLAGSATQNGFADGTGAAARFSSINDIVLDGSGNAYLADLGNFAVRKVTPSGVVSTIAGGPSGGAVQLGPLPGALSNVYAVERTPEGHLLVTCENAILRIVLTDQPAGAQAP